MQMLSVENDGTTRIEFTDTEAHQLRDLLVGAASTGDDAAWTLQRLLSHAHGEPGQEG